MSPHTPDAAEMYCQPTRGGDKALLVHNDVRFCTTRIKLKTTKVFINHHTRQGPFPQITIFISIIIKTFKVGQT